MALPILSGLALSGAALVGLTRWRARRNEARAEAKYPPLGQFIEIEGKRVHAHVAGSGPDLVLIHGSSGHLRDFTYRLAPALTDRFRVIVFDRPGLGYSDPVGNGPSSLQDQARVLSLAAQHLGAARPIVLGQSLGGAVALAWAVHHPDRLSALVTVSGVSHPWTTGLGAYYSVLSSPVGQKVLIPLITAFVPDRVIADQLRAVFAPDPVPDGFADHFGPRLTLRRASFRANAMQRRHLLDWVTEQVPHYPRIVAPTEILHARGDRTVSSAIHSETLARAIPGANLTLIDGASHMPHHTDMGMVIGAIERAASRAGLRQAPQTPILNKSSKPERGTP